MKIKLKSKAYDNIVALIEWIDNCPACTSNSALIASNSALIEWIDNCPACTSNSALIEWIDNCPACTSNSIVEQIDEDIMDLFHSNSSGGEDVYALETKNGKLFALVYDHVKDKDEVVEVSRGIK